MIVSFELLIAFSPFASIWSPQTNIRKSRFLVIDGFDIVGEENACNTKQLRYAKNLLLINTFII